MLRRSAWGLLAALALTAAAVAAGAASGPSPLEPGRISTALNEYNLSYSADGRTLVFARSKADFAGARIMTARKGAGRWSEPERVAFSDERWSDSDPWLTPDGRVLYFVSDRPTASRPDKTDLDIWRSRKVNGRWSEPEHLGDLVNSAGQELGPEVHDGMLYFSSTRAGGAGGLDIYAAPSTRAGAGAALRLEAPLNTSESESDFTISPDGRVALFWRWTGGKGVLHAARRRPGGWSEPAPLPAEFNQGALNFTPTFVSGRRIAFAAADAPGGLGLSDLYQADLPRDAFR